MAEPTTTKGGKIKILLGNDATPIVYGAPCGLTQRSMTISKGLEEFQLPDCDDPDAISWLGRDATSLSMSVEGETLLAEESVETWVDAAEAEDSIPAKVIWEFPAKTLTWTGNMHVENFNATGINNRRATATVSMQSDGKMTRVVTP
ncbi:phage tail tube protein [Pararhizobium gei]|uniref:phage tail tube protein n=1 Tax=Pararhizobium gei TaxID=1395951 RepID=UPI0023DC5455|nr:phage tail tube protein [Rhizobium gei]